MVQKVTLSTLLMVFHFGGSLWRYFSDRHSFDRVVSAVTCSTIRIWLQLWVVQGITLVASVTILLVGLWHMQLEYDALAAWHTTENHAHYISDDSVNLAAACGITLATLPLALLLIEWSPSSYSAQSRQSCTFQQCNNPALSTCLMTLQFGESHWLHSWWGCPWWRGRQPSTHAAPLLPLACVSTMPCPLDVAYSLLGTALRRGPSQWAGDNPAEMHTDVVH